MKVLTVKPQMLKGSVILDEKTAMFGVFFIVCGAIGNDIKCVCRGFDYKKMYGWFFEIVERLGGIVLFEKDGFKVRSGANMKGQIIEYNGAIEYIPALSVMCAFCKGESRIKGISVSDRECLNGISAELSHLGARTELTSDGILINGCQTLRGDGTYIRKNPYLAMALLIAGTRCEGELYVMGTEELKDNKFDEFMEIYNQLIKEDE